MERELNGFAEAKRGLKRILFYPKLHKLSLLFAGMLSPDSSGNPLSRQFEFLAFCEEYREQEKKIATDSGK